MQPEENEIERLRSLAAHAAPIGPRDAHLTEDELRRVKAGEPEGETVSALDDAHRHLASCSACRARLVESPLHVEAQLTRARKAAKQKGRITLYTLAAAALIVLGIGFARVRPAEEPVTLVQRSYVGTMGATDTPRAIAPEDRNVEILLRTTKRLEAARALVIDDAGGILAGIPPFIPDPADGALRTVIAPRMFPPRAGALHLVVVFGDENGVKRAVAQVSSPAHPRRSFAETDAEISRAAHDCGVRVERAAFGPQ
jgi:hypothetical protein